MGGDGGSIPGRVDLVKTAGYKFARNLGGMGYIPNTQVKAGDEKFSKNEERNIRWSTCAISQEPLRYPVVACPYGNLYNKEALIKCLLSKSLPQHIKHLRGLNDVKDLKAQINNETGFLICPITSMDLQGGVKAYLNWNCGCVLSEKAMKNIKHEKKICLLCGTPYKDESSLVELIQEDSNKSAPPPI